MTQQPARRFPLWQRWTAAGIAAGGVAAAVVGSPFDDSAQSKAGHVSDMVPADFADNWDSNGQGFQGGVPVDSLNEPDDADQNVKVAYTKGYGDACMNFSTGSWRITIGSHSDALSIVDASITFDSQVGASRVKNARQ